MLFRTKLSPFTPGKDVPEAILGAIWKDALPLMRAGMVDRRIVTTRPEDRPAFKGEVEALQGHPKATKVETKAAKVKKSIVQPTAALRPDKEEVHYVYRRNGKPCFLCGTTVLKREMATRNLFWCPVCQAE